MTARLALLLVIAISISSLIRFAYVTGSYVGAVRVRIEAMNAGAGHYDLLHGNGRWVWTHAFTTRGCR